MTKNTHAVSATAIATWSSLLKKRGTGSFLPATTNIVVSTMMLPSIDMQPKPYRSDRRTSIHSPHPRVLQGKGDPVLQKNEALQLSYRASALAALCQFGSPIKK